MFGVIVGVGNCEDLGHLEVLGGQGQFLGCGGPSGVSRRDVEALGSWRVWGQIAVTSACGLRRYLKLFEAVVLVTNK